MVSDVALETGEIAEVVNYCDKYEAPDARQETNGDATESARFSSWT